MKKEELEKILELHKMWLNDEEGGVRANLCKADLSDANLCKADLIDVNLGGANLIGANLSGADLSGANLRETDLIGANLRETNLIGANLNGADLSGANLNGADLSGANLRETNLTNIEYNENTSFMALQCLEEGSFIAYKKVADIIIKLEVPEDAKRSSATTRKCRCSKAKVLGFYDLDRNELNMEEVINCIYGVTVYRKGEMVYPDSWDEDRWNECSNGIHFFVTFDEAKNY